MISRLGPVWLVVIGIISVQVGAAVAKSLFGEISPTAMVWLRLATSAIVLVALARPRFRGHSRDDWWVVVGFGLSLGTMNWAIYQSFALIPLGIAVTIEFIGPLTLAVLGSRRARDVIWVLLAAAGVVLLGFEPAGLDPLGVAYALLAGASWAAYIQLSASTGRRWPGFDGLAVASLIAAVAMTLPALVVGGASLFEPRVLLLGVMIGLLSSVIPYSAELVALRSLRPAVFGILMSLEPAAAALAAIVVLDEHLSPLQWLAIACVVGASVGATRSGAAPAQVEPAPD
ncbi:MAG: EamA family transporter [Nocardioides sp.]|nr:EamA family transporter [Nocardioides sp.]